VNHTTPEPKIAQLGLAVVLAASGVTIALAIHLLLNHAAGLPAAALLVSSLLLAFAAGLLLRVRPRPAPEATATGADGRVRFAELMFDTTDLGVFVTDAQGTILKVNQAFCDITGYGADEAIGNNPRMLKSHHQGPAFYSEMWSRVLSEGRWRGRLWNRRKNGEAYLQQVTITMVRDADGQPANYVAVISDATELHEKERHIEHQAYHDALTDLPNRLLFNDRLEQAVAHAARVRENMAVMVLDLDRFKLVNDTFGHAEGDLLLQAVAARLGGALRESDTISRFGGDEFAVLATGLVNGSAVKIAARALLESFRRPFSVAGHEVTVTPSIGIALFPDDGRDGATLLKNADAAMYRTKERGRNGFTFYTPDMNARALAHLTLENDLRRAVAGGEFELHYQPRFDLRTARVTGMEALIRWRHPERGLVPPGEFIPLAEETGLIVEIGDWVLLEACRQAEAWRREGHDLRVSVNISARQFTQQELLRKMDAVLAATRLPGDRLELELTESLVMQEPENTIAILAAMKARGIWIAVDDFGTGYSSLAYLKRFPIDILKIDRSFINDIHSDPNAAAIATTITALGHSLRMEVIAEGVETEEQFCFLRDHQCDTIQGYLYSKPLPAREFIALVREQRGLPCRREPVKAVGA
jgi:diguanylate cyclase (GGDEF)-like protein/PAS domain S-box-containing protein